MSTFQLLAVEYGFQPYELADYLNLGIVADERAELDPETEREYREALDTLVEEEYAREQLEDEDLMTTPASGRLSIVPLTFRAATEFVSAHHRHHKPPVGHKFSLGVVDEDGVLHGVAIAGRPVARNLDDGLTLEVTRTCTDGARNANSKLYGAVWRAARAMGYRRLVTYTQDGESGASLRAAGATRAAELSARGSWAESSVARRHANDPVGAGGVARIRWEWTVTVDR